MGRRQKYGRITHNKNNGSIKAIEATLPTKTRICLKCRKEFVTTGDYLCGRCNYENVAMNLSLRMTRGEEQTPESKTSHRRKIDDN